MKLHGIRVWAASALAWLSVLSIHERAVGQLTVTSLVDNSGPGTLRTAIMQATSGPGNVTILFDPSLSGGTIQVLTALPNLNKDGITIEGDINGDGIPDIELDGSTAPSSTNGLNLLRANCLISGLIVNRFTANGIRINGVNAQNNTVRNCYIGTDAGGTTARPNTGDGILINAAASNNTIGPGNVISGNNSVGINISAATGNTVKGNLIGTDAAGTGAIANISFGINIANGSTSNVIGGINPVDGNVVSGNASPGIRINGPTTTANTVLHNYCGVDSLGLNPIPNNHGILLNNETNLNIIGPGNVVSGNDIDGIQLSNANNNTIKGNLAGTDPTGTVAVSNLRHGIHLIANASGNYVGGTGEGDGNVVSGNDDNGIHINGSASTANVVAGNRCGTNLAGTAALPNGERGIALVGSTSQNVIGPGNLVSGNTTDGIQINNSAGNTVKGNIIGADLTGQTSIPNQESGVLIAGGSTGNEIGGINIADRNVISGNTDAGVAVQDAATTGNHVIGNYIGCDLSGESALGNGVNGVHIKPGSSNTTVGPGNVISGNVGRGINVDSSSGNTIRGNRIGTNAMGQSALGNTQAGIILHVGATGNQIGGPAPADANVISGNMANGVTIQGSATTGNVVQGNLIGSSADGMSAVGNIDSGILFQFGTSQNTVGPANAIRGNGDDGVRIQDSTSAQIRITQNSIWSNNSDGIAIATGAQGSISAPIINGVTASTVSGTAASGDGAIVEVFSDLEYEGEIYLGSTTLSSGQFLFNGAIPLNRKVTATVTDTSNSTSAFSTPYVVGDNLPSQAPPCDGDFLVASRRYGTVYSINSTTGLIRGLVTGLELRDDSGLVRGDGPVSVINNQANNAVSVRATVTRGLPNCPSTPNSNVAFDLRLLSSTDGSIFARFGAKASSFGVLTIDRHTGNRAILPGTSQAIWDDAGDFFFLNSHTVITTADHWNTGTMSSVLSYDLNTNVTTEISGPTVGDGPLPLLLRPVALLDAQTLVVSEVGLTCHTEPPEWQNVGVYLIDIATGDRTFLSRLTAYRDGFDRSLIVNGSPAGTVTLGDDEGGVGPVMNTQCRSLAVVNGRILVSESIFIEPNSFLGGLFEIDRQTGDRNLVVGHAFVDDGTASQIVEVLPTGATSVNLDAPVSMQDDGNGNLLFTHLFGTDDLYPIHRYNLTTGVLEQLAEVSSQVLPEYADLQLSGLTVYRGPSLDINEQPADLTICEGGDAQFSVVACANPVPDFQWRLDGIDLSDDAHVQGAATDTLSILASTEGDAGIYDCVMTNTSGEVTSIGATLSILVGGTGDGTGDSLADGLDIQGFISAILSAAAPSPGYCAYDMSGDGIVTMADLDDFVQLLLSS